MRNTLVKFAALDMSNQCSEASLVPDTPVQTMRTLVPDGVVTDVDSTVWTLKLKGLQDFETGGLAAYLLANNGTIVSVAIAPVNTTGKKQATVSVRILPVTFGGPQGEFAQFDVELPVQGQPTWGTAT
jgi:hypothetical protein